MLPKILSLAQELDFPKEMQDTIAATWPSINIEEIQPHIINLTSPETAPKAHEALAEIFAGNDDMGYKSLISQLLAALQTRQIFADKNIADDIFIDTVKCLSRFSGEHLVSFGHYGFNRGWWSYRYLCGTNFRLGALEFEIAGKALSVHIPSDAVMTAENLGASYAQAAELFPCMGFEYEQIYCNTWLLYPTLQQILPPTSRILTFQKDYEITKLHPESKNYQRWVYKNEYTDLTELPESTSLQRNLKKWLLAGGEIGDAHGIYKH